MFIKVIESNTNKPLIINTDHIVKLYKASTTDYTVVEYSDGDIDVVTHSVEDLSQLLLCQEV